MAYCFKKKEPVRKAVRRLVRKRMERALECLEDCRQPEAIHCARQHIKKARAVLRLVRPRLKKKAYSRQIDLLREAAQGLASTRDAHVNARTLEDLMAQFKEQLAPGAFRHVRATLQKASDEESTRFAKTDTARPVKRILRRISKNSNGLIVRGKGWKAVCPGLEGTYARGRRAHRTVLKDPSPENFHEWRKRAKDLSYHARLLRPLWPEQMDAMTAELDTLGEYLGDDHDFAMLRQAVAERCSHPLDQRELEILNGLIDQRQRELRAAALALGARFYAEKQLAFCSRLKGYWRIWRRNTEPAFKAVQATS